MLIYCLYIFFGEVSVNVLAHFLTVLIVSYLLFQFSLYILDNSSLSDVTFAIFLKVCGLSSNSPDIVSMYSTIAG